MSNSIVETILMGRHNFPTKEAKRFRKEARRSYNTCPQCGSNEKVYMVSSRLIHSPGFIGHMITGATGALPKEWNYFICLDVDCLLLWDSEGGVRRPNPI